MTFHFLLPMSKLDVPLGQGAFLVDQASLPRRDLGDQSPDLLLSELERFRFVLHLAFPSVHFGDLARPLPFAGGESIRTRPVVPFEIVELTAGLLEGVVLAMDREVGVLDGGLALDQRRFPEVEGFLLFGEVIREPEHPTLTGSNQLALVHPRPGRDEMEERTRGLVEDGREE